MLLLFEFLESGWPEPPGLQVLSDVRTIIAEQLGTDLDKVAPDSKFVDLGADSLDTVEIMMALEEKFDLQVTLLTGCLGQSAQPLLLCHHA